MVVVKVLVVILNKDNAEGLKKVLNSLVNQVGGCRICECFDVLVLDGGSKDHSLKVVEEFRRKYSCISFKVQEVLGGVGPARLEAIKYALNNGYEYMVWGDSENAYREDYITKILSSPEDCDVVSGKPLIRCESLFEKLFFWYHAYHVLFKYVRRRHAPGNNKLVKTYTYFKSLYLPIIRTDDFYFSIIALKKNIKFCYNEDAVVTVTLPDSWEGIKSWQRARVLGSVQGAILLDMKLPPDFMPWFLFSLYPFYLLILYVLVLTAGLPGYLLMLILVAATIYIILKLLKLSREVCLENCLFNSLTGFVGMYLHSLFTTYYTLNYVVKYSKGEFKKEFIKHSLAVMEKYGFNLNKIKSTSKHTKS